MARRKIREYDAKMLLAGYLPSLGFTFKWKGILITPDTNLDSLPHEYPWLLTTVLVVKPDQLFGQRGKLGLVGINLSFEGVKEFLSTHRNKEITIGKATDRLTHFLIEPYQEHKEEYYLDFSSQRNEDIVYFSTRGGIDIEENWYKVISFSVPTLTTTINLENITEFIIKPVSISRIVNPNEKSTVSNNIFIPQNLIPFIQTMLKAFRELDFTDLELNPFTIDEHNQIHILDTVAQIDDSAAFRHHTEWKNLTFPRPFGRKSYPEEEYIANLDRDSGASLKLTILNPKGRIWNILSGGGASIIYLDTMADLGKPVEIANYGEYSGNPTTEESYQYAKTILKLLTREHHQQGKVLVIGGAIANFTDVEKTFTGIIKALREYQEQLHQGKISIFVRRGGPNYEKGLQLMREAGKELNIPILVQGPDTPMVEIVGKAMEFLDT